MRIFRSHSPSPEDLERARAMSCDDCPRRYCWWWVSLAFEWDKTIADGCTFDASVERGVVSTQWPHRESPCKRNTKHGNADHYEPREPHLMEDGFAKEHFG